MVAALIAVGGTVEQFHRTEPRLGVSGVGIDASPCCRRSRSVRRKAATLGVQPGQNAVEPVEPFLGGVFDVGKKGRNRRDALSFLVHAAPPELCPKTQAMGFRAVSPLQAAWVLGVGF